MRKALVEIDDGHWVDPEAIIALWALSFGSWGVVRVKFYDGSHLDVRRHETEMRESDPEVARDVIEKLMEARVRANDRH